MRVTETQLTLILFIIAYGVFSISFGVLKQDVAAQREQSQVPSVKPSVKPSVTEEQVPEGDWKRAFEFHGDGDWSKFEDWKYYMVKNGMDVDDLIKRG